jgi:hypothetical protein
MNHLLFRKDSTLRERATVALANLQRNAYAMSMLRSRIESRVNFILKSQQGKEGDEYRELERILELVRNGELILNELSGKIEAVRFLEEFVMIIDGAAESVGAIKGDVEHLVPLAESALAEMHDAISRISSGLYDPNPGQAQVDLQNSIIAEAKAAVKARVVVEEEKGSQQLQEKELLSQSAESSISAIATTSTHSPRSPSVRVPDTSSSSHSTSAPTTGTRLALIHSSEEREAEAELA